MNHERRDSRGAVNVNASKLQSTAVGMFDGFEDKSSNMDKGASYQQFTPSRDSKDSQMMSDKH